MKVWICCLLSFLMNNVFAQSWSERDSFPYSFTTSKGSYCVYDGRGFNGQPQYTCTCNNIDAATNFGTEKLWPGGVLNTNLGGAGMNKLGMWDGGSIRKTHVEFGNRVINMDSLTGISGHSTAVAGNMIAAGLNANVHGMSFQANLREWDFTNDNAEIIAAGPSLFLSNHSYTNVAAWYYTGGQLYWTGDTSLNMTKDWKFGYYDNRSRIWDSVMYANPYYLMVKAAGNDRGSGVAPGTPHLYWNWSNWVLTTTTRDTVGPYDCMNAYSNAKNVLTVGAFNVIPHYNDSPLSTIQTLSFSDWGPTDDGRIKPDLIGPSGSILSVGTATDSAYAYLGATSIAAPAVTGSLLLLQELSFKKRTTYLRNATLKGLAIHTADGCKPTIAGPNYECGWGIPNIRRAAQLILNDANATPVTWKNAIGEMSLQNGDSIEVGFALTAIDTAKITLSWTDPKAENGAPAYNDTALKLINDLDMRVRDTNNIVLASPYILDPYHPSYPATTGDNYRDNLEQIKYVNGSTQSQIYKMRIKHKGSLQGLQAQTLSVLMSASVVEPMLGASNLMINKPTTTQLLITCTKGRGYKRLILLKAGSPISNFPKNGSTYVANALFGSTGALIGGGTYVVYNDTGNQALVSGLTPSSTYFISIVEYNGTGSTCIYANRIALNGSTNTLPVLFVGIEATQVNDQTASVQWSTASEINCDRFEVERSLDGVEFMPVALIRGSGNSQVFRHYEGLDQDIGSLSGVVYYRIKQVDYNGQFTYSKQVALQINHAFKVQSVIPNPFQDSFTVKLSAPMQGEIQVSVFTIQGELKMHQSIALKGSDEIHLNGLQLNPGIYFIQLETDSGKAVKTLVKQ